MFEHYVGEVVPYFAGVPELPVFSIHGSKALVKVFYNSHTAEEIEQFDAGKSFEIRMIRSNDVLFLCYKIGALNWMDNAYDAALDEEFPEDETLPEGQGFDLTLMFVDAKTGEIKCMRSAQLSEKFSNELLKEAKKDREEKVSRNVFLARMNVVYKKYTTKELVKFASSYCKSEITEQK